MIPNTTRCYQVVVRALFKKNQVSVEEARRQYLQIGENLTTDDVRTRIVQLFLWMFGEGAMNIRNLSRNLSDQVLIRLLKKRVYRHYAIKDGLKNGLSFQQIQLQDVIRKWQQEILSKSTLSGAHEDALRTEIGQTLGFLTQPQLETLSWKNHAEPLTLKRLVQEQIDGTLYLYQFVDRASLTDIQDQQIALVTSLLGKGVALYLNKMPYSWIEALEDWSEKGGKENQKKFDFLKKILPLFYLIKFQGYHTGHRDYLKSLLKKELPILEGVTIPPCSFQEYITHLTCLEIEQSLFKHRGWQPFFRKKYEKSLKDSEFLRWNFLYYLVLNPNRLVKSPPKGDTFLELMDLLRPFRFLFILEKICSCPLTEQKESKRQVGSISQDLPDSHLMEKIFLMIADSDKNNDSLLEEWIEKIFTNKKIVIPSKFTSYLKWKKQVTVEGKDEFFIFTAFLENENRFNDAFSGYQDILQLLKQEKNIPIFIEILRQPDAEEIVKVILEIAQSHLANLDANKVMVLLRQNTKYPAKVIKTILRTFSSKVLANVFNNTDTGILHLLIAPTYYEEFSDPQSHTPITLFPYFLGVSFRRGMTTSQTSFVTQQPQIPAIGGQSVNGELFFKLYRKFVEGKKTMGQVYLLLQYRTIFDQSLSINDLLYLLQIDLPKPIDDSMCRVGVDYWKIFTDPFFKELKEIDSFTMWFSWAVKKAPLEKIQMQIKFFETLERTYGLTFPSKTRFTILTALSINQEQIQAVITLAKLRAVVLQSKNNFALHPEIINRRDQALQKLIPPQEFADTSQGVYTALNHIWNACFVAFSLSFDQVLADALTLKEVTRKRVIFADPTFNHCAVIKELIPGKFVVVDWQPPIFTHHPELKVLIIDQENGRARTLSFPLMLSSSFTASKQMYIFKHLKELANIVLNEGGGMFKLENIATSNIKRVCDCYPKAQRSIEALTKIDSLQVLFSFIQQLKTRTRAAWLDIVLKREGGPQINSPLSQAQLFQLGALGNIEPLTDESYLGLTVVGGRLIENPYIEEKTGNLIIPQIITNLPLLKRRMNLTLSNKIPKDKKPFYSSLEITNEVLKKASLLIKKNATMESLVELMLDGGFSRELRISSSSYSLGPKMFYKVQFCVRTEVRNTLTSSTLDYPDSLINGPDFSNVFQIHVLGFKSDIYKLILQKGKKNALASTSKNRKERLPTIIEGGESVDD